MALRRWIGLLACLVLGAALAGPVGADEPAEPEEHFPTPWVELGRETPENSFAGDPDLGAIANQLGADLRNGSVRMLDAETLEFRIELWNLPATGGTPEVIRYTWDFEVEDAEGIRREAQIDGKWSNYSRGACDPTSGQCDPPEAMPRDPGMQPFLFRANQQETCLGVAPGPVEAPDPVGTQDPGCAGMNFFGYEELGVLQAAFDVDEATITVAVPLELFNQIENVELGHCSVLHPRAGIFGGMIEAMPSAFVTSTAMPADTVHPKPASQGGGRYVLPPAPDAEVDCAGNPIGEEDPGDE